MTIRHLKIFVAVAEAGTMSGAAAKCYVSQPTVSQTIHELEEHYGVQLFDRLSKRLYITKDGVELLSYAQQLLSQYDQMEQKMLKNSQTESLRIGGTITVGSCLLSSVLNEFHVQKPDVETYTYVGNTKEIERKLLKSELDVAIVEGEINNKDLVVKPIIDDFLGLIVYKNHPYAKVDELQVDMLQNQQFVMREDGSGTRQLFEKYLVKHRLHVRTAWEAKCPETIRNAVMDCSCLATVSVRLFEKQILEGNVKVFLPKTTEWNRSFKMVYHKDRVVTDSIECMQKILHMYKKPEFLKKVKVGNLID
ncbi:MAG: LysR family transcriptional regulator [Hespellia sp.]|nr:LysR family transcriptional regulator [Hespellia sp.]